MCETVKNEYKQKNSNVHKNIMHYCSTCVEKRLTFYIRQCLPCVLFRHSQQYKIV